MQPLMKVVHISKFGTTSRLSNLSKANPKHEPLQVIFDSLNALPHSHTASANSVSNSLLLVVDPAQNMRKFCGKHKEVCLPLFRKRSSSRRTDSSPLSRSNVGISRKSGFLERMMTFVVREAELSCGGKVLPMTFLLRYRYLSARDAFSTLPRNNIIPFSPLALIWASASRTSSASCLFHFLRSPQNESFSLSGFFLGLS